MATSDDNDEKLNDAEDGGGEASSEESSESEALATTEGDAPAELAAPGEGDDAVEGAVTIGSERYVHAAFFVAGILAAYIASKTLVLGWNSLSGWPAAVRRLIADND